MHFHPHNQFQPQLQQLRLVLSAALLLLLTLSPGHVQSMKAEQWKQRSIYQVVTDRFAPDTLQAESNPCDPSQRLYCGGTWQGIIRRLDYIQGMGFDAIWISPVTKQIDNTTDYGQAFHGYWQQDLYSVNPHFGTSSDLLALSQALHARGMALMVDVVVNHFGSPYQVDYSSYTPFNDGSYFHEEAFITDYSNQTMVEQGWLGNGQVPLPDVDTENGQVVSTFNSWISTLVQTYQIDGLRLDTVKHVRKDFWPGFVSAAGVFALGEVLSGDPNYLSAYQPYTGGLLDYGTYYPLLRAFTSGGSMNEVVSLTAPSYRALFTDTQLLATFMENHDMPRFPVAASSDLTIVQNAMAYTLLSDGIPIIYYGQEQSFSGAGDPTNREGMWTSGFKITALYTYLAKLNRARSLAWSAGFGTNLTTAVYVDSNASVTQKGPLLLVLSNQGGGAANKTVSCTTQFAPGTILVNVLTCQSILVGKSGNSITIVSGMPQVYLPQGLAQQICTNIQSPVVSSSVISKITSMFTSSSKAAAKSATRSSQATYSSGTKSSTSTGLALAKSSPTTTTTPSPIMTATAQASTSKQSIFNTKPPTLTASTTANMRPAFQLASSSSSPKVDTITRLTSATQPSSATLKATGGLSSSAQKPATSPSPTTLSTTYSPASTTRPSTTSPTTTSKTSTSPSSTTAKAVRPAFDVVVRTTTQQSSMKTSTASGSSATTTASYQRPAFVVASGHQKRTVAGHNPSDRQSPLDVNRPQTPQQHQHHQHQQQQQQQQQGAVAGSRKPPNSRQMTTPPAALSQHYRTERAFTGGPTGQSGLSSKYSYSASHLPLPGKFGEGQRSSSETNLAGKAGAIYQKGHTQQSHSLHTLKKRGSANSLLMTNGRSSSFGGNVPPVPPLSPRLDTRAALFAENAAHAHTESLSPPIHPGSTYAHSRRSSIGSVRSVYSVNQFDPNAKSRHASHERQQLLAQENGVPMPYIKPGFTEHNQAQSRTNSIMSNSAYGRSKSSLHGDRPQGSSLGLPNQRRQDHRGQLQEDVRQFRV